MLSAELPSCGCVQEVMPVSYTIHNRTNLVQEVEGAIEPSDYFMFSGNSQVSTHLLSLRAIMTNIFIFYVSRYFLFYSFVLNIFLSF